MNKIQEKLHILLSVLGIDSIKEVTNSDIEVLLNQLNLQPIGFDVKQTIKDLQKEEQNKIQKANETFKLFDFIDIDGSNKLNENKIKIAYQDLFDTNINQQENWQMIQIFSSFKQDMNYKEFNAIFQIIL